MRNNHDKYDPIIKELFRNKGLERPSDDFTNKVMGRIEPSLQSEVSGIFSPLTWLIIGAGLAAAIFTIFFFDVPFIHQVFPTSGFNASGLIEWISNDLALAINDLFSFVQFSSLSIIVLVTALGLLLLDRLLGIRKRVTMLMA